MTLTSSSPGIPITYKWSSLPQELRLQIFGYVAGQRNCRARGLSRFACVSSEWQDHFERIIFRRLMIDNSQLLTFSDMTERQKVVRLSYIRYLCLRIKLKDYDYPECHKEESIATIKCNNRRFSDSLIGLFNVLCRWEPSNDRDTGLILEITAYSPGDNNFSQEASLEYAIHNSLQLEEDLESSLSIRDLIRINTLRRLCDPGKNWHRPKTEKGLSRLQGTPLELSTTKKLKQVPIVHTLWIRHQFYRGIDEKSLVRILRMALTSVVSFRLETFGNWISLILQLPHHIRQFSLNLVSRSLGQSNNKHIDGGPEQPKFLAEKAHHLVALCPPGGMNPLHFIRHLRKSQQYQELEHGSKLEQLCLEIPNTARGDAVSFQSQLNALLEESAVTARELPNLQIMEIWWDNGINACLFRYELEKDQVTITWRVTENWINLTEGSKQQWARVAKKYNVGFSVKREPFCEVRRNGMRIDGKSIYRDLKLCDLAVDPVTLAYAEMRLGW
ncbi:uncharacterized protein FMAN_13200 [Fusarium mangiferae]|uniref:DUF6546 domain-containing protein n=1 Tax=Fusarium mangiferae TaxID=192010 RepID=A0A1L7TH07_FUSMA|nr:uncharacterized protein FMAN_13200 [Fusarium mangiferae]CVK94915.1 uncharacterized protein FMAN_13200 [Fusarium mangiferae]